MICAAARTSAAATSSFSTRAPTRARPSSGWAARGGSRPNAPSARRSAASAPGLMRSSARHLEADPSVVAIVPDEVIQSRPRPPDRRLADRSPRATHRRRSTASTSGSTPTWQSWTRASPTTPTSTSSAATTARHRTAPHGATSRTTARTWPAPSPPRTTPSASSAWRRARASGRSRSSTTTATACSRGTCAASTGSSPSVTRPTPPGR